jgi:hypothetical protein
MLETVLMSGLFSIFHFLTYLLAARIYEQLDKKNLFFENKILIMVIITK